jgi:hypothetical protein
MDLTEIIEESRREKERWASAIASVEALQAAGHVPVRKRRGRESIPVEERRKVSATIKKYWEDRHKQRRSWS